jgi:hypothetical protein
MSNNQNNFVISDDHGFIHFFDFTLEQGLLAELAADVLG